MELMLIGKRIPIFNNFAYDNKSYRKCDGPLVHKAIFKTRKLLRTLQISRESNRSAFSDSGEIPRLIVSLTTYPARFMTAELAIRSILSQSLVPSEVHLWLGSDCDDVELPQQLLSLQEDGLFIHHVDGNIKGHKKYFYVLQEEHRLPVVTIDDDCIYPYDLLESLWFEHIKWPNAVIASRARQILVDGWKIKPYNMWNPCFEEDCPVPRSSLLGVGVGGILYPPHSLSNTAFNKELIYKLGAIETDDLWLKVMEMINGTKVVWARSSLAHPYLIETSQQSALNNLNVERNNNDIVFKKLMDEFGLRDTSFGD